MAKDKMTLSRCACGSKKVVAELGKRPRTWLVRCLDCDTKVSAGAIRRVDAVRGWNFLQDTDPTEQEPIEEAA